MKAMMGGLAVLTLGILAGVCPDHVRARAAETIEVSDETRAELSRQVDHFIAVMRPETPDLTPDSALQVTEM